MFILKTPRGNGTNRHYEYRISNVESISDIYSYDADEVLATMEKYFGNSLVFTSLVDAKEAAGSDSELHKFLFSFPRP